jgi:hypothetical protein
VYEYRSRFVWFSYWEIDVRREGCRVKGDVLMEGMNEGLSSMDI